MKIVIEDRELMVCHLDFNSCTVLDEEQPSFGPIGKQYGGLMAAAIDLANSECEADPALKIRITIETVVT